MKMRKIFSLAAISASAFLANSVSANETLTFVSFGGAYGGAQEKYMVKPYESYSGNKVLVADYSGGIAELKAQVDAGNVTWDVLDMEYVDVDRACDEGLLEVLDPSIAANGVDGSSPEDDFLPGTLHECAIGNIIWTVVFAYNKDTITGDKNPKTITDLFNTKKYPGKRGLRKRPQTNLEWALIADGVAKDKVYDVLSTKEGQDRAFKKLDTIKKDVVWYDSWSQAPQLLNDGGVVFVQVANGRIFSAIKDDGRPFVILWDAHGFDFDGFTIPKGSKNRAAAEDMIRYMSTSNALATMENVAYGPTRKSSAPYVSKDVLNDLPSAHFDEGYRVDGGFWADYGASLSERFNAWILQ